MPKLEEARELQLAERIRQGDPEAFEEFAQSFGRRLRHYSLLICRQREDAEEVVQDTLLQLHAHIAELREPTRLRPWAFRIARNTCLMKRRGRRRAPRNEVALDPAGDDNPLLTCTLANGANIRQVYAAIAQLPAEQLMVVLLRSVEGMTTGETAEVLGVTEESVKGRLKRARQSIQEQIAGLR